MAYTAKKAATLRIRAIKLAKSNASKQMMDENRASVMPSHQVPKYRTGLVPKHDAARPASLADRDRLVLENLSLVKVIAVQRKERLPVHADVDDLIHSGILGLLDAAIRFNPGKQVSFASYAKYRIRGAMLDSLRQLDWASRDLRRRHKQIEAAARQLSSELHRCPTEAEIPQRLGGCRTFAPDHDGSSQRRPHLSPARGVTRMTSCWSPNTRAHPLWTY